MLYRERLVSGLRCSGPLSLVTYLSSTCIHARVSECECVGIQTQPLVDSGHRAACGPIRRPGEPNFENGKLVCPVSTFIRSPLAPSSRFFLLHNFNGTSGVGWTYLSEKGEV